MQPAFESNPPANSASNPDANLTSYPSRRLAFRIFTSDLETASTVPANHQKLGFIPELDPHCVAVRELLRPLGPRPAHRDLPPWTRAWFEELEMKRYAPPGDWLRRGLEFTRHKDESLLMIGPGAGTDAIHYLRQGVAVTVVVTEQDWPNILHQQFQTRGHDFRPMFTQTTSTLPLPAHKFDLAYLNLCALPELPLQPWLQEVFRVLKPGGKLFLLAPSHYHLGWWTQRTKFWSRPTGDHPLLPPGTSAFTARQLRQVLLGTESGYGDMTLQKRHLRRSDLPRLARTLPVGWFQRWVGQVWLVKAFKPLTTAYDLKPMWPAAA